MDINYWLIGSQNFINELYGVTAAVEQSDFFAPEQVSVDALQFPLLNFMKSRTRVAVNDPPAWYTSLDFRVSGGNRVIQLYSFGTEYSADVVIREDLQAWQAAYPNDVLPAGAWDVATGEPVGGVGSPWFTTPPELILYMPDEPTGPGTFQPATKLAQINLLAGQAGRKFV